MQKPPVLRGQGGLTEKKYSYRNIVSVSPKFNQTFRQAKRRKITDLLIFTIAIRQGVKP